MSLCRRICLWAGLVLLSTQALGREIVIATIEENPANEVARVQPLADYLAANLRDQGVTKGRVFVAADLAELVNAIQTRKADLFIDSLYPVVMADLQAGLDIRLRRWKKGKSDYNGLILAMKDSDIAGLADLRGKLVGFEEPSSTSAYYLPLTDIEDAGLETLHLPQAPAAVPPDRVGYVFTGDEENSVALLLRGRVQAIGVGTHDYAGLKPREKERVKIVHETRSVPRQLVGFRTDIDKALVDRVCDVLKGMDARPDGRVVLETFERTVRFDDVPAEGRKVIASLRATLRKRR